MLRTAAGAMAVRLDLLKKNFVLSLYAASIGVILPIGLSYALCYVGFGYGRYTTRQRYAKC